MSIVIMVLDSLLYPWTCAYLGMVPPAVRPHGIHDGTPQVGGPPTAVIRDMEEVPQEEGHLIADPLMEDWGMAVPIEDYPMKDLLGPTHLTEEGHLAVPLDLMVILTVRVLSTSLVSHLSLPN
jgi:hypothetical protein